MMGAASIITILNLITGLIPIATQLASDIKATASDTDQASIDAALAAMVAAANTELTQAESDLDAAAKT